MLRLSVSKSILPSFSRVDTQVETDFFRKKFLKLWGLRVTSGFPGCNPKSIGRHDLNRLRSENYFVSLKSDGVRYALFLTTRSCEGGPVALMIDRTWTMYEVEVVAPEEYFEKGTIFEGELVWKQPTECNLIYLVFDTLVIKGTRVSHCPFKERLDLATRATRLSQELATESSTEVLEKSVLETDSVVMTHFRPNVTMRPKSFVDLVHARRLWNERIDVDHRVDGLIMNVANCKYVVGTASNGEILKWKPQPTVDLKVEGDAVSFLEGPLSSKIHGKSVKILTSRVQTTSTTNVFEFLIRLRDDVVEFFPLRLRSDKTHANSERVVLATVQDVIDDVKIEEVGSSV